MVISKVAIKDKKALEIKLSSLLKKEERNIELEQYQSSSSLVSFILWRAYLNGDIAGKKVADLGCGNGIFGIGALLLGASSVVFLDVDAKAIELARKNVASFDFLDKARFVLGDVSLFSSSVDTVVMNPPFGVKVRKADKAFLEKAFTFADSIYSLHKIESKDFISKVSAEYGFKVVEIVPISMEILRSYSFHKLDSKIVDIGLWVMRKIKQH